MGVIVAVRAPAPFLGETLESVISQVPEAGEIVVVDHASEPAIEPRAGVRIVRLDDPAGGPAAARDAGLAALDTELIALADADDVWERGKLAAQLAALAANPDAAVCFGRALVVDEHGDPTGERWPELARGVHAAESLRTVMYEANPIPAASAVIRRSALDAVGGFTGEPPLPAGSDWDLWLRLVGAGYAFLCEPGARIRYRRHAGGVTHDVAALAQAGLTLHEKHAALVAPDAVRRTRARDLVTLARGRIRQRRYGEARSALEQAAAIEPLRPREKALLAALHVPGLRALLGRRSPYPR